MKRIATLSLLAAFTASGAALAQSGDVQGMDMNCMDMKGKDMKACQDKMKGVDATRKAHGTTTNAAIHKASAVVKAVDPATGNVTLAHEAIKSLKWPPMTMGFSVRDKSLFDKLAVGKKVEVELTREGSDYVVTAVK